MALAAGLTSTPSVTRRSPTAARRRLVMRIAFVASQSSSPSSGAGPGGQRVTSLADALARLGHQVTVYAPKDSPKLPRKASLASGVTVEHLPAGARDRTSRGEAAMDIPAFSDHLARRWRQDPPDIAHAHFWTTGLAALAGARGLNLPVVQTFHSLGALQTDDLHRPAETSRPGGGSIAARGENGARTQGGDRRQGGTRRRGGDSRQPDTRHELARIRLEVCLARNANAVLATSSEQMTKLAGLGVPPGSIPVVAGSLKNGRFAPGGPVGKRNGHPRLVAVRQSCDEPGPGTATPALA